MPGGLVAFCGYPMSCSLAAAAAAPAADPATASNPEFRRGGGATCGCAAAGGCAAPPAVAAAGHGGCCGDSLPPGGLLEARSALPILACHGGEDEVVSPDLAVEKFLPLADRGYRWDFTLDEDLAH